MELTKPQLISLQRKFKTDRAIGDQYGVTRQAVHQLRKKYGIPSSTGKNSERNVQIMGARKRGCSVEVIAKNFKLSVPRVYSILRSVKAAN